MPLYTFKHIETGEEKDMMLSIADMEKLKEEGEWVQVIQAPTLVTHVGSIVGKTPDSWKSHLKSIQKVAGQRVKNTINV